jgi:hypothetical protein
LPFSIEGVARETDWPLTFVYTAKMEKPRSAQAPASLLALDSKEANPDESNEEALALQPQLDEHRVEAPPEVDVNSLASPLSTVDVSGAAPCPVSLGVSVTLGGVSSMVYPSTDIPSSGSGVKPMIDLLSAPDDNIICVALQAIENILIFGKQRQQEEGLAENPYAAAVESADGLSRIEALQSHPNDELYAKAVKILTTFFPIEVGVSDARAELRSLLPSVLKKKAIDLGANRHEVDSMMDRSEHVEAVIDFIIARQDVPMQSPAAVAGTGQTPRDMVMTDVSPRTPRDGHHQQDANSESHPQALVDHPVAAAILEEAVSTAIQDNTCLNEQTTEEEAQVVETVPADSVRESQDEAATTMMPNDLVQEDIQVQSNLEGKIEIGDIVLLRQGVPQEFYDHAAMVVRCSSNYCTVVVLDESRRYGIGECWPNYENVVLESTMLRLGTHVLVAGLQSARTKHLNGQVGVISTHPKQGHPVLIDRPAHPNKPQLTICVALHDSPVILEPRFLSEWHEESMNVTRSLSVTAALLMSARI